MLSFWKGLWEAIKKGANNEKVAPPPSQSSQPEPAPVPEVVKEPEAPAEAPKASKKAPTKKTPSKQSKKKDEPEDWKKKVYKTDSGG